MSDHGWPRMMRRAVAASYCDLTPAAFTREVLIGKLPGCVLLDGQERWSRAKIDEYLDRLTGEVEPDWRSKVKLYAQG